MSLRTIPRFLLPRGTSSFSSRLTLQQSTFRNASTRSSPRVLEKPAKFNPPSHPASRRSPPRSYPGPPLSEVALRAQKTKKYPNMMPAEGTFMHWFLTNRSIHMYISLGTLTLLTFYSLHTSFRTSTAFADMLPPISDIFYHPIAFMRTYIEVFKLHTAHVSAETAERRKQKVEDVRKRGEYRKAHGLEDDQGFGGWVAKKDGEGLGPAMRVEGSGADGSVGGGEGKGTYTDWEGKKRPVKKWLGIW